MFTHQKTTLALLLFFLCYCVTLGQTLPTIATIPQQEYASRRSRLVALLDTTEAIAMKAANFRVRSNDVSYRYRQESNFLYATGLNSPGHYLLAAPKGIIVDGKSYRVVLFVAKGTDDSKEVFAGENELILDAERFGDVFKSVLAGTKTLYASTLDLEMVFDWLNDRPLFVDRDARKNLERDHPELKVKNPSGFFAKLRVVKSNNEIGLIQEAIELTAKGIQKALVTCKSDGYEYELQAAIEGEMIGGGASYTGFPSIIGSGENSLVLHYDKNRRRMKSGELVVMDVGAEYGGYSADITRTIPVSGKFSSAQKEVYGVVLRAMKEVELLIKPGATFAQMEKKAREVISDAGYKNYIRHGVSHFVGLDVHDIGGMSDTLKPGMVVTVEPGIYIPRDDKNLKPGFRGFGIRIEDDVLVTENGSKVLTQRVPREIRDIENGMKKKK